MKVVCLFNTCPLGNGPVFSPACTFVYEQDAGDNIFGVFFKKNFGNPGHTRFTGIRHPQSRKCT
jgi:hypothetical protein